MDTDDILTLVGVLILLGWIGFALWVRSKGKRKDAATGPEVRPVAIDILLRAHRIWSVEDVRAAAVRAWGMVPEEATSH